MKILDRPRYSELPLPAYSYVPSHAPHPISDPAGHWFDREETKPAALVPDDWRQSGVYCFGCDLFNHGFYWEAHEAWESLWHAANRQGATADWLKALIKLAAAVVKAREGNPRGVERHARRALELVDIVNEELPPNTAHYCGLSLARVEAIARGLIAEASQFSVPQPELVIAGWLELDT